MAKRVSNLNLGRLISRLNSKIENGRPIVKRKKASINVRRKNKTKTKTRSSKSRPSAIKRVYKTRKRAEKTKVQASRGITQSRARKTLVGSKRARDQRLVGKKFVERQYKIKNTLRNRSSRITSAPRLKKALVNKAKQIKSKTKSKKVMVYSVLKARRGAENPIYVSSQRIMVFTKDLDDFVDFDFNNNVQLMLETYFRMKDPDSVRINWQEVDLRIVPLDRAIKKPRPTKQKDKKKIRKVRRR